MNDQNNVLNLTAEQQDCTPRCDGSLPLGCAEEPSHDDCLTGKSLAMVYSPCQSFQGIYTPEEALRRGTIFMELEKPFWGARRVK